MMFTQVKLHESLEIGDDTCTSIREGVSAKYKMVEFDESPQKFNSFISNLGHVATILVVYRQHPQTFDIGEVTTVLKS